MHSKKKQKKNNCNMEDVYNPFKNTHRHTKLTFTSIFKFYFYICGTWRTYQIYISLSDVMGFRHKLQTWLTFWSLIIRLYNKCVNSDLNKKGEKIKLRKWTKTRIWLKKYKTITKNKQVSKYFCRFETATCSLTKYRAAF